MERSLARPLLLKLGFAVAFSLAGYLRFRIRRRHLSLPSLNVYSIFKLEAPTKNTTTTTTEQELAMEREIAQLSSLVGSLKERERSLEAQMLELQGLREQEATLKEVENRLNIAALESKSESLQDENQRLLAQLSDRSSEFECARDQIQLLNHKLRLVGGQAKEEIAALQQRIAILEDNGDEAEAGREMKRLNELEEENSELKSSVANGPEAELKAHVAQLREENDKLKEEIDKLRTDRFADVKELVFLRWINACLRYEMRNYQSPPGKSVARDLRQSFSPESEQKAKQLILDHADSGISNRSMSFGDFGMDYRSSSQASTEEPDDAFSNDVSSATKCSSSRRLKFFKRLKNLVLRKDHNRDRANLADSVPANCGNSERSGSLSSCSSENAIGIGTNDCSSSSISVELASEIGLHSIDHLQNKNVLPKNLSGSLEVTRLRNVQFEGTYAGNTGRCRSDLGTSYTCNRVLSEDNCLINLTPTIFFNHVGTSDPEKAEMRKFAEALKSSHRPTKLKTRAASFSISR